MHTGNPAPIHLQEPPSQRARQASQPGSTSAVDAGAIVRAMLPAPRQYTSDHSASYPSGSQHESRRSPSRRPPPRRPSPRRSPPRRSPSPHRRLLPPNPRDVVHPHGGAAVRTVALGPQPHCPRRIVGAPLRPSLPTGRRGGESLLPQTTQTSWRRSHLPQPPFPGCRNGDFYWPDPPPRHPGEDFTGPIPHWMLWSRTSLVPTPRRPW